MRKSPTALAPDAAPTSPAQSAPPALETSSQVERAFRLLRFIAEGGATGNVSDIGRRIGVNRVTVMRLLASLEAAELIVPVRVNGVVASHQLAMGFLTLAASALGGHDLTSRAKQVMSGLAETTGLSVYLVVRDGRDAVYLLRETPDTPLVSRIRVGSRLAAHTATSGLVLLAPLPDATISSLYARQADGEAPVDLVALRGTLARVREQGCAWSFSGLEAGIDSCAVAVTDRDAQTLAALSLAGPSARFPTDAAARADIERVLKAGAAALSRSQL